MAGSNHRRVEPVPFLHGVGKNSLARIRKRNIGGHRRNDRLRGCRQLGTKSGLELFQLQKCAKLRLARTHDSEQQVLSFDIRGTGTTSLFLGKGEGLPRAFCITLEHAPHIVPPSRSISIPKFKGGSSKHPRVWCAPGVHPCPATEKASTGRSTRPKASS